MCFSICVPLYDRQMETGYLGNQKHVGTVDCGIWFYRFGVFICTYELGVDMHLLKRIPIFHFIDNNKRKDLLLLASLIYGTANATRLLLSS